MKHKISARFLIIAFSLTFMFWSCSKEILPQGVREIQKNIQQVLDSVINHTHVPGLVAGVWAPDDGIDFVYSAGVSNLETKEAMSPDMIFRIGSNTKTFTITLLLMLVDEGSISLNSKLSEFLPGFPRSDEVSIEMLGNMTSGIPSYTFMAEFGEVLEQNPTKFWTTEELIALAASKPFDFDPGTSFRYSNSNTIIAGRIVEIVTGQSLESQMIHRIINPLGLKNTNYLSGGIALPGYHPSAYYMGTYDPSIPELSELIDVSWGAAAGSAYSDIYELKTYAKALANGDFLSASLQQTRMVCRDVNHPLGFKYGLGMFDYKGFFGHNGSLPGFTSLMVHSPSKNCTIIIWYNCQLDESTPTELLKSIPHAIYPDL